MSLFGEYVERTAPPGRPRAVTVDDKALEVRSEQEGRRPGIPISFIDASARALTASPAECSHIPRMLGPAPDQHEATAPAGRAG